MASDRPSKVLARRLWSGFWVLRCLYGMGPGIALANAERYMMNIG
jgi:hypothetical protein